MWFRRCGRRRRKGGAEGGAVREERKQEGERTHEKRKGKIRQRRQSCPSGFAVGVGGLRKGQAAVVRPRRRRGVFLWKESSVNQFCEMTVSTCRWTVGRLCGGGALQGGEGLEERRWTTLLRELQSTGLGEGFYGDGFNRQA